MAISTAVDVSAVARVVGIKTDFKDLRGGATVALPQRIAVIGQGSTAVTYSNDKRTVTSAVEAGQLYGTGSPVHLAVQQLLPTNGDGVGTIPVTVYPLSDAGSGVASTSDITPGGTPTESAAYTVRVGGVESAAFVIAKDAVVADITAAMTVAINSTLDMPVIATDSTTKVDMVAKWAGTSSNAMLVEVIGSVTAGVSFAITAPNGGLINPDVQPALDQFGGVWESMVLNCLELGDADALDTISTFGEGRWGPLTRKPFVSFVGSEIKSVAGVTAITDLRKTDRTNSVLIAPGSPNMAHVIAARQLARIALLANNNAPHDYGSQPADGLIPGDDSDQWSYIERDQAIKAGSSSTEVRDGVVTIGDVVTFYHPDSDPIPSYRYVVDIVKLQQVIFNLNLIFATTDWDGAPLIPDNQPTTNRSAKQPKAAVAAIASLIDNLGLEAVLSDPVTAKSTIQAEINSQNPKRLDITFTAAVSGNVNILSIDFNFGFYFGGAN